MHPAKPSVLARDDPDPESADGTPDDRDHPFGHERPLSLLELAPAGGVILLGRT